jgi:hypothetical protein
MCRVSTQIAGRPASAKALYSHCDSGPAFKPVAAGDCDRQVGLAGSGSADQYGVALLGEESAAGEIAQQGLI